MTLPTFIIIGAAKAGSTFVERRLAAQPDVFMSPVSEVRFFAYGEGFEQLKGPGNYHESAVFDPVAYESLFDDAQPGDRVGERSSLYLYSDVAAGRIAETLPDVRLIALLRDPVDRALSMFSMNRRLGLEPEPDFRRALDLEEARTDQGWSRLFHYMKRGLYGEQLRRYYEQFEPRQLKVFLYDDLVSDPPRVIAESCAFVGSTAPPADLNPEVENRGSVFRSQWVRRFLNEESRLKSAVARFVPEAARERIVARIRDVNMHRPRLSERERRELFGFFRDDIAETESLIGRDLSAWRR